METQARSGVKVPRLVFVLVAAFSALIMGATAAGAQNETDDPALVEQGEAVYAASCAGCHGADGAGSDAGRPLTGIAVQERDRLVHIASVTDGKGGMPAFGGSLSDEEIDAAVTFVRLTFVAEQPLDELPNTGFASDLLFVAAALMAGGVLMVGATLRRPRVT